MVSAMKFATASTTAVLGFALFFSVVEHPLLRIAGFIVACGLTLGLFPCGARETRWLDEVTSSRPRRAPRGWPFLALALVLAAGGCRPEAATVVPEPAVALAEVDTLDCGGRSCAVTEVAGVTLITVTE